MLIEWTYYGWNCVNEKCVQEEFLIVNAQKE